MDIQFEKVKLNHKETIFNWLKEPHVQEFWDNSQEHKDDIINFMEGRKQSSNYCNGLYSYWIGLIDNNPYCLFMTLQEKPEYDIPIIKKAHLSQYGHTYSIDYMIGNTNYVGKGLGAKTLKAFIEFMRNHYDTEADTFFIDPDNSNPKAKHIYEQAGFTHIGDFIMEGNGVFARRKTHFLVKHIPKVQIATIKDYPVIQNMARFYVYDLSRECGNISSEWNMPADGLYESFDFKIYFEDPSHQAYIIKINNELAGFVLLNKLGTHPQTDWNMGEFFIIAKFQGKGIGQQAVYQIFEQHPGTWEISVIPENQSALKFWHKVINTYTQGHYTVETKIIPYDPHQPKRIILSFNTAFIKAYQDHLRI